MEGYTILYSGRQVPESHPADRNEGVGIVLDLQMTVVAWQNAGEAWKAVSSGIVVARLKLVREVDGTTAR